MSGFKKNEDERGCLWVKQSARGEYMTGTIDDQPVVVFRNEKKVEGDKQPTWRVLKSKPKSDEPRRTHPVSHPVDVDDIGF